MIVLPVRYRAVVSLGRIWTCYCLDLEIKYDFKRCVCKENLKWMGCDD